VIVTFHTGERVTLAIDPRHEGRVVACFSAIFVRVQWLKTGWKSDHLATELVRLP
jgi:hypothetical protein